MGNSKQKIIDKLNCIPDDLSEEEIIERLYRMMRLEDSKQRYEKEGSFTDEQVTAHFADKSSALDRGIEDMEAGRELPLQEAMEKVTELRNERRNAKEEKGSDEIENKRNCENKKKDEAMLELYSLLGQGYKAMQEGCESSIDEVKERIYFNE